MKNREILGTKLVHKAHGSYIISILTFNHYFNNEDYQRWICLELRRCKQVS